MLTLRQTFGTLAQQLDTAVYNNLLDTAVINSWYTYSAGQLHGGTGRNLPLTWTVGKLTWVSTTSTSDRLRTTNTDLTRYDANIASVTTYTGRIYVNGAALTTRYLSLALAEDDEVTLVFRADADGKMNFYNATTATTQDVVVNPSASGVVATYTFRAKTAGTYRFFDNVNKPSYFRVYRKDATYVTIHGTIDTTEAHGIPGGYGVNFTNDQGKVWNAVVSNDTFNIKVPAGYTYSLGFSNANGYIMTSSTTLNVTTSTTSYNITALKCELHNVSGSISGLSAANLAKLGLVYTADTAQHKIYVPAPVVNTGASTYSLQLEPGCKYKISATGVNDYYITSDTITIGKKDTTLALTFATKPVYGVTINTTGLTTYQASNKLNLTFNNLNEPGYSYKFTSLNGITLRDGTYSILCSNLDSLPVKLGATSNLVVSGTPVSKTLAFGRASDWSFDDKAIASGSFSYEGLLFTGTVAGDSIKGHLVCNAGSTIKIPLKPGYATKITYYYAASFKINSGTDTTKTSSGSTSILEYVNHTYNGSVAGFDTIKVLATTYITEISIDTLLTYQPIIYVGADKDYKTINDALTAIGRMSRTNSQRVTVMIDPGNYEEMLVINLPNVTLKNAATTPSIAILNKGVDINANAVRITSYYGTGYNYYSMGTNQKWSADALRVNKGNGYTKYTNTGAGTTNGSYWNSTVVVTANGFEADDIIFENSYNQYISKKESEDVVVMWTSGGKGIRPTDVGNTGVQNRSFVERACALAFANNADKGILNNCRIIGRQDALYGGTGSRFIVNKGVLMGAVDYIFGAMTAVFYKTQLVMNVSDVSSDATYIAAAQQTSGRGYLFYKCAIKSAIPGIESASTYLAQPGIFGRPWQANTAEVVFYYTTVDTTNYPGYQGKSLIQPVGWNNSLGGNSSLYYERGTIEKSGENNLASRASWATELIKDTLTDGTAIKLFNFTKGTDNWAPFAEDTLSVSDTTLTIAAPANSVKTFDITSNMEWTATSNQTWLNVDTANGSGNATITLKATANPTTATRSATVTVKGIGMADNVIKVTQNGAVAVLEVSSNSLNIAAPANSTNTFEITSTVIGWTVKSDQTWLTVSKAVGTGNDTITITANENTATTIRTATITVSGEGVSDQLIKVTQKAEAYLTVSGSTLTIGANANSTQTFDITSNTSWTVTSNQTWLTVSNAIGSDTMTLTLSAAANPTTATRSATITVKGTGVTDKTITVTQDAGTTGITGIAQNAFEIFPNPASNFITIKRSNSSNATLTIFNSSGQIFIEKQIVSDQESIDITSLPKGFYILKLQELTFKIVIK